MPALADHLQFAAVSKEYPGVKALVEVGFGVAAGSVHALLGENGAGKSTLLKVLSGAHLPTSGGLLIDGKSTVFRSTADAIRAGVAVIYQELHTIGQLSVAENLFLGHLPTQAGIVQRRRLWRMAAEQLHRFGEEIDPKTPLAKLSIGQRQMIEIAKALSRGAKIIAFDEPTSSLSAREIDRLFEIIRDLKQQGCAILYVTHRMDEVFQICDAATVLRDGRHVVSYDSLAGIGREMIVKAMVGRDIADIYNFRSRPTGQPALEIGNVIGPGINAPVSFSVAQGEIVGMFGLVGAGRTELLRLIYGATPRQSGTIRVSEKPVAIDSPTDAIRAGVLLCPEDRKKEGIVPVASIMENINLSARRNHARAGFIIRHRWERENANGRIAELAVKTPSIWQQIRNLSGGNQQKVILARWLSESIKVMLLDEPTRGIDVGAKSEIYSIIYRLADRGAGIVVVSSELPEVLGICDRVLVMRQGQLVADLPRAQATPERILALALPISNS
jgi:L-arabinose transport system ATP-binding protein